MMTFLVRLTNAVRIQSQIGIVVFVLFSSFGCGKIPTWQELTGSAQPPATPVPAPTPTPAPVQETTPPPPPPKPSPEVLIAQFKALPSGNVSDGEIAKLCEAESGLEQIESINATGSQGITENGLALLKKLPAIKTIELNQTKTNDKGMEELAHVPSLQRVSLNFTLVTDRGLAALSGLPTLQELELRGCTVTPEGFAAIGRMPALTFLYFDNTPGINDVTFDLLCNCKTLKRLMLSGSTSLTDRGMVSLKKLESIEQISIAEAGVTGEGLAASGKMSTLKFLNMWKCPITVKGAKAINNVKSLEYLAVGGIPITDEGFHFLVKGLTRLKELQVTKTLPLQGAALKALSGCKDLEVLVLNETGLVDKGLLFLKGQKNLKKLDVSSTLVTQKAVLELKKALPECEILAPSGKY
ncbi:MAG: hypothetical protein FJ267_06105 [Planctomycetes bacterium]|nr:hypothetical protein [Planctomycetota bacterium]